MKEKIDFLDEIDSDLPFKEYMKAIETRLIINALNRFNCNVSKASQWLGINRTTLVMRMQKQGIVKKGVSHGS